MKEFYAELKAIQGKSSYTLMAFTMATYIHYTGNAANVEMTEESALGNDYSKTYNTKVSKT